MAGNVSAAATSVSVQEVSTATAASTEQVLQPLRLVRLGFVTWPRECNSTPPLFWYQFLHFRLTYFFTHHFFLTTLHAHP